MRASERLKVQLIYDVAAEPALRADVLAIGTVLGTVCLAMALGSRWSARPRRTRLLGWGGFGITALVVAATSFLHYDGRRRLLDRIAAGEHTVVEGVVQDFVAGDWGGHTDERWRVVSGGGTYAYAYRWSTEVPGFHESAGPIRAGQRIRLIDVDGYIARLEILPEPPAVHGCVAPPTGPIRCRSVPHDPGPEATSSEPPVAAPDRLGR